MLTHAVAHLESRRDPARHLFALALAAAALSCWILLVSACGSSSGAVGDDGGGLSDAGPTETSTDGAANGRADGATPSAKGELGAASIIIDVFEGKKQAALSAWFGARIDGADAKTRTVQPRALSFAFDGEVVTFPFAPGTNLAAVTPKNATAPTHAAYVSSTPINAPPALVKRCAKMHFKERGIRTVLHLQAAVEGQLIKSERSVKATYVDSFPPIYPLVLCHRGVGVKRLKDGFLEAGMFFRLRPDGLYDAQVSVEYGSTTYVLQALQSVDPLVTIMPVLTFGGVDSVQAPMKAICPGCTAHNLLTQRFIASSKTIPIPVMSTASGYTSYWCDEPEPGDTNLDNDSWPPSKTTTMPWSCGDEGTAGVGILRFTGVSAGQPVSSEVFAAFSGWYYQESPLCKIGPGAC